MFFSVAADREEIYDSEDIIKFHHTFSNVNPGFPGWNPETNMFTCPYDGYYLFMVTLYKADQSSEVYNVGASLVMSIVGSYKILLRLQNFNYNSASVYFSSTMQAIVPCEQGQNVWVSMTIGDRRIFDSTSHLNQFSGLLIKLGLE